MLASRHIAAYTRDNLADHADLRLPLVVNCAGWYRDVSAGEWECRRAQGRKDYLVMLVVAGTEVMYRDGARVVLEAGDLAVVRPREPQHIHCEMSCSTACWVHFTGRDCEAILAECGLDKPVIHTGASPEFEAGILRIIDEILARRRYAPQMCAELLRVCLLGAARRRWELERGATAGVVPMEQVVAYVNEHYRDSLTVEHLARRAHLSRSAFTRAFRAFCGVAPIEYLISLRIQQARNLLTRHAMPVKRVAAEVGYENPLYFSRLFRRHVGQSPEKYARGRR